MLNAKFSLSFGNFRLEPIFHSHEGNITAIFGQSGAGKTSIVKTIAGLITPNKGTIKMGENILYEGIKGINMPPHKREVGYVFQDGRLFPHMSVKQNLLYGLRNRLSPQNTYDFEDIVKLLHLRELLDRMPPKLSGCEIQRTAIGRALLSYPRLLLMDEPLASIDLQHRHEILPFIKSIRESLGITIIYVTHSIEEVIYLADDIILISEGKVVAQDSVETIMSRLDLLPLTNQYDAGSVISVKYIKYDSVYDIGELEFQGGTLHIPGLNGQINEPFRAHIRARDVSLMLAKPEDTSVLNVLEGNIIQVSWNKTPHIDLLIDVGVPLIATITKKSFDTLDLRVGSTVFAMIKAVAIKKHYFSPDKPKV
ncbi:MAG: molybdenum ABC transporter ATP-binding protein [Pseudomonadota bacterium]|nr:molybdenum ABC transporter ATP-binding protein [Pseudomonadota bacterium]